MSNTRDDSEAAPRQRYRKSGPDQERNRATGRARRYAQVGGAVGGLAARLAGTRLGFDIDKTKHSSELREALGGVRGPLMKVAQILATVPDALPEEYAAELRQLQSNAPAMGWAFVKRRMTTELGPGWQQEFASFEREAAAAASLGQVHRAWDHDGRKLACKLQYPNMQSAVEADLKQLNWALQIYKRYDSAIDTSNIYQELSDRLREELDYGLEGRHMAIYRDMLAEEPGVHVPDHVQKLSTDRLLSMTWLEGTPIWDYIDKHLSGDGDGKDGADTELRTEVAYNMFRAWYVPFYYYGVIHGDPHLGNYSVVEADRSINLLDFGCIRTFNPVFVKGVIDLYFALERDDWDLAAHAYEQWGFTNLNREMLEVLNMWAKFLYAPLLEDSVRPIQEGQSGLYGAEVASKVHRELKRLGGVKPPREFVLMDRAAIGLGSVFMRLKAEINWHRLFHELIGDFDVDKLASRQSDLLDRRRVPRPN